MTRHFDLLSCTFVVPLILSFLILSIFLRPHVHLDILVSATSNVFCAFFDHSLKHYGGISIRIVFQFWFSMQHFRNLQYKFYLGTLHLPCNYTVWYKWITLPKSDGSRTDRTRSEPKYVVECHSVHFFKINCFISNAGVDLGDIPLSRAHQIRQSSNPAGLPVFAAIWGADFRATSIIILTNMFKQIKQIRITLTTMFKVNPSPPNEVR